MPCYYIGVVEECYEKTPLGIESNYREEALNMELDLNLLGSLKDNVKLGHNSKGILVGKVTIIVRDPYSGKTRYQHCFAINDVAKSLYRDLHKGQKVSLFGDFNILPDKQGHKHSFYIIKECEKIPHNSHTYYSFNGSKSVLVKK